MNMRWRRRRGRMQPLTVTTPDGVACNGLNTLHPGSSAQVFDISAGHKARTRLASLGLIPGSRLQVVANPGFGPLLLSVGESRLMVERGIAEKVLVRQVA